MPYRPRTREFWLEVGEYKCRYEYYTEKWGWRECGEKATHVHHIIGEHEQLEAGENPDESVALILCTAHHVRNNGQVFGEWDSSFHPDMGEAYKSYKEWKANAKHLNSIGGRKSIDYSTSPFAEAARGHREAIKNGERYINGDEMTDEYYIIKMRALAVIYLARHPELTKPIMKPHPLYNSSKKKHWWNHE